MIPFSLGIWGQGIQYWCYFYKGIFYDKICFQIVSPITPIFPNSDQICFLLLIFNFCKTNKDGHIKKIFQLVFEWWTSAKIIICIFSHKICKNSFFFCSWYHIFGVFGVSEYNFGVVSMNWVHIWPYCKR